jgi:membrane protease subunit HflC
MNRTILIVIGAIVIALGIVVTSAAFIVHQTEQAIVLQFGDPKRVVQTPGLHFKLPFIQNVTYFDNRILDFAPPQEEIIAADQKRLVVDSFVRYRIADPLEFYKAVGSELAARGRLAGIISAALRRAVGNTTLSSVLSNERNAIMQTIRADTNEAAVRLGLDVVDFRIRRADLPQANAEAIYQRMQSEREREAREFRAQGAEIAQRIRARAERERTVLLAESQRQSQVLRGEGDANAIRIYAEAFGRDMEFFSFYRSMEAYRQALRADSTTLVLSPDSDFFSYFHNSAGGSGKDVPAAPASGLAAAPVLPVLPTATTPIPGALQPLDKAADAATAPARQ